MATIFPYRLRFEKTGRMKYLSHHELMRVLERAIRRSGIPIRLTEGFNPHPVMSFPTALGIAIESVDEVMEMELSTWVAPKTMQEKLGAQLPAGLTVRTIEAFDRRQRSYVDYVEYEVGAPGQTAGIEGRIAEFLAKKEHVVTRDLGDRSKQVNVRPYAMAIDVDGEVLYLRIRVTDSGSARPEEVLEAIGVEMRDDVTVRKTYTELKFR